MLALQERFRALGRELRLRWGRIEGTRRVHEIDVRGLRLSIADGIDSHAALIVASELQRDCYRLEAIDFAPGDVVVDVGGHVGLVSCALARWFPFITIYTFEPVPETYRNLVFNLSQNGIANVRPFPCGLSSDGRTIELAVPATNTGGASCLRRAMVLPRHTVVRSPSRTLDSVFEEYGIDRCKLLKIDCEGAEHEILLGSRCLERVEHLRGEFHCNRLLLERGYSIEGLLDHCARFIPAANILVDRLEMGE